MGNLSFAPVSMSDPLAVTPEQLKTIYKLTRGTPAKAELVGHNPSATVELYIDPVPPSKTASRYHISADGTYDMEQCEVPEDDGDWEWDTPRKKIKRPYLSDKFTIRDNPSPMWDQQFSHDEIRRLLESDKIRIQQVWTVVEGDNGKLYALTGIHFVNRMHYVITEEQWTEEDEAIDYKW